MSDKVYFFEENDGYNFYIGENAGGKMLNDIRNAKKSVHVISPFISDLSIDLLRKKKETAGGLPVGNERRFV